jgi:RNA polymerase sigma-70 factor (ECF subfamily)
MYLSLMEPESPDVELDVDESASARAVATEARDRVRFEEEALALADDAYRVARRLTGSTQQAEDLVQDAYTRAFRSWRQYRPGTNMRAWLLRIVHNLAIDAGRRKSRTPESEPVEESDYYLYHRMAGAAPPEETEAVVAKLSQNGVVSALAGLPQQYRDTVVLVDLADFSYQDAADILDVPIGTVMSRLHRGRRMLKTRLAESLETDEEVA